MLPICKDCLDLKYRIGYETHFGYRWEKLGLDKKESYDKACKYILEYISGMEFEELEKEKRRYKNIAIVKFDGNLIGQIIASVVSITDACERSYRIDYAVKKAFSEFLSKVDDETKNRIVLGTLYIGGDDGCLIVPSRIAIPLALHMMNGYFLSMGCKSTLSVGIAVAKPKHPISFLYESADELLEIAKKGSREYAYKIHAEGARNRKDFRGALAFYTADGGVMDRHSIRTVLKHEYKERLSSQYKKPYILSERNSNRSIIRLLSIIDGIHDIDDLSKTIEKLIDSSKDNKDIKEAKKRILEILRVSVVEDSSVELKVLYTHRMTTSKENDTLYRKIGKFLVLKESVDGKLALRFSLLDAYNLIKILEGE